MAKRKNTSHGEKSNAEPVQKVPAAPIFIHPISLITGSWRRLFTEDEYKMIIVQALNECIYREELIVAGYLITSTRVCLILEKSKIDARQALLLFYEQVRKEIRQYRERMRNMDTLNYEKSKLVAIDESVVHLFAQYPLVNDHLIRLLTGRPVNLRYYDPHLQKLKDKLHNNNFCSAKDYSGARGPVVVKLITRKKT